MSDTVIALAVIGLMLYFEWELVKTALMPIVAVVTTIFFIARLIVVLVMETALIVVAPIALVLGYESREWHIGVARKLMLGGKPDDDDS